MGQNEKVTPIIAKIEKVKNQALTQAQKDLDDGKYHEAMDGMVAAKLMIDSALKATRPLWEAKKEN